MNNSYYQKLTKAIYHRSNRMRKLSLAIDVTLADGYLQGLKDARKWFRAYVKKVNGKKGEKNAKY